MNLKLYYFYKIFYDLIPIYPLYLLFFESKGLSINEISILLAIWSAAAVILEIPTGVLADHWNRRNMLVIGGILKAFCYIMWIIGDSFHLFAIGFVFWGIGGAFQSGSEEALLYDTLKVQEKEDCFDEILGKGRFLSGISNILASLFGGYIGARFGFEKALYLSVLSSLLAALISTKIQEINLYKEYVAVNANKMERNILRNALTFIIKNPEVLFFSLIGLLVITTAGVLDEYDQLIAKEYGLSVAWIGIWSALRFMLISFGSYFARGIRMGIEKFMRIKNRIYSICFLCLMAAFFLILSGVVKGMGIMSLYGLYYFIMAAGEVIQEDYIQQKITMEGRSTVHSVLSLTGNFYAIMCFMLFGAVVSQVGLLSGLIFAGLYIIIWVTIIGLTYMINKKYIGAKRVTKNS